MNGNETDTAMEHARALGAAVERLNILESGREAFMTTAAETKNAVDQLAARMDELAVTQAATIERLAKLEPAEAVQAEAEGTGEALEPGSAESIEPPPAVASSSEKETGPIRRFHDILG